MQVLGLLTVLPTRDFAFQLAGTMIFHLKLGPLAQGGTARQAQEAAQVELALADTEVECTSLPAVGEVCVTLSAKDEEQDAAAAAESAGPPTE